MGTEESGPSAEEDGSKNKWEDDTNRNGTSFAFKVKDPFLANNTDPNI